MGPSVNREQTNKNKTPTEEFCRKLTGCNPKNQEKETVFIEWKNVILSCSLQLTLNIHLNFAPKGYLFYHNVT